jgi:hypothetical protein
LAFGLGYCQARAKPSGRGFLDEYFGTFWAALQAVVEDILTIIY